MMAAKATVEEGQIDVTFEKAVFETEKALEGAEVST